MYYKFHFADYDKSEKEKKTFLHGIQRIEVVCSITSSFCCKVMHCQSKLSGAKTVLVRLWFMTAFGYNFR